MLKTRAKDNNGRKFLCFKPGGGCPPSGRSKWAGTGHDVKPRRTLVLKLGLILEGGQQGAVPYIRVNGRLTQCYHQ